jgi:hypothetical protein
LAKAIRHIQIKAWPEITSYTPAIIPFQREDLNKENPLDIDFSSVTEVHSSGLVLILIKLLKVIDESRERKWLYKGPEDKTISDVISKLGFVDILQKKMIHQTFIWNEYHLPVSPEKVVSQIEGGEMISFPIYEFSFASHKNKRELVDEFRGYLFEHLTFLYEEYGFKVHKLIGILTEMAKNAADNTNYNAFFGLDNTRRNGAVNISFSFGDLGEGINVHFRKHLLSTTSGRAKHLGLVETYKMALTPGQSAKQDSLINRGIGMSIIMDLSKDLGLELSVFDAESRGILSRIKELTHNDLRKIFYHLGKGREVGFYYFGTLNFKRK